jgi:hypothetical protein
MKKFNEIQGKILAHSSNGAFEICSYIVKRHGKRIYGFFDHVLQKYIEKPI